MRIAIALLGLVASVGCATARYTPDQVDELTLCRHASLDEVEANLVSSGYLIERRTERYLQTGYQQVAETSALATALSGRSIQVRLRITARSVPRGVRWDAHTSSSATTVGSYGWQGGTVNRDADTDEAAFAANPELARTVRRAVCGDTRLPRVQR